MKIPSLDPQLATFVEKPDMSLWIGDERQVMSYPINSGIDL